MKKFLAFIASLLIILTASSCNGKNPPEKEDETYMLFSKKQVESFETITIRESGMRVIEEYKIINKGDICEISFYQIVPISGTYNDQYTLLKSAEYDTEKLIALMNECGFASWNGFDGKHPKNVHDGIMFGLDAVINGNETVTARGSQNFPKKYKEFMAKIKDILVKNQETSS